MILRFEYGTPFETYAVVEEIRLGDRLPYFRTEEKEGLVFTHFLAEGDTVYGLGETMRGINKRGGRYISYNTDDVHHREDMPSLYSSHNFLVVDGAETFGAFFDTPSKVIFEVDYQNSGKLVVRSENRNLRIYIITGASAYGITRQFLRIIGRSFLPPLWAFGFGQSRWGYKNTKDIEKVVENYREAGIPLDYVCMDIDYMDRYIDFTVNKKRFPDLTAFVTAMKKKGIRLVPIIDAGIKVEAGNPVYEEGVKKGYFCTNHEGAFFKAAVWPGMTHFPDFFRKEVRDWFGRQYKVLTDCGIEGFWNDMNEPSIFYSEYSKRQGALNMLSNFLFPSRQEKKENSAYQDYKNFYHDIGGKKVLHHEVHNLYGGLMTMASGEGLKKLIPRRYLLFSRSSYIGAHRYGGIWTGDNSSKWEHLRQNVYQMPSLNMCGFLYSGADTGGFGGNTDRELLLRWLAFSAFTPLMRNHTALFTRRQECYQFGSTVEFAGIISLRYRLLPYIYSEFMKAALRSDMYFKPMAFGFPGDEKARKIEDQLLVGECIMIAPMLEKGKNTRKVYLPEPMTQVRYDGENFTCKMVEAGDRTITVPISHVVFYIRKGKAIPVGDEAQSTREVDLDNVELIGDGDSYEQYIDDGCSPDCSLDYVRTI